jgi:hypothetical protein
MTPALCLLLALSAGPATPTPIPEVRLAPQAARSKRALEYELLTPELDRVAGNAAPIWIRAGIAARRARYKWKDTDWEEMSLPPGKFSVKKFKAILEKHADALRLADSAALRSRCDWGLPPLTLKSLAEELPFDEMQTLREVANLMNLRCRVELAERRFGDAVKTLRAGFTLARHASESDLMVHGLVGMAITAIFLERINEWVQIDGSPNLYWPLSALPRPFIDIRRPIRAEMGTIHRTFPILREFSTRKLSNAEATAAADRLFDAVTKLTQDRPPGWLKVMSVAGMVIMYHDKARAGLLSRGWTEKELAGMPPVQVVVLNFIDEDGRTRDDVSKLLGLPGYQRYPLLAKLDRELMTRKDRNALTTLLMPALTKVQYAQLRTERLIDGLRGAEALRQHAFLHKGAAPAKWADIKAVPLPRDPFTGGPMDGWYRDSVLTVPPPPGSGTNLLGRRYVLPPR